MNREDQLTLSMQPLTRLCRGWESVKDGLRTPSGRSRLRRRLFGSTGALVLATATACAVNPATGERELMLMSESQEIRLGREYDQQIVAELGLYPDSALQAYVQSMGSRMASRSERPNLPWTFRVLDDPVVNAFALPGGFIYVTRGILAHLDSEAELAAVIGHEIGHVTARHSASKMSRTTLAQLGLGVTAALVPEVQDFTGLANAGLQVLFLKFGRDDESESDELGLRYMRATNYDVREMPHVFEMLASVSKARGGGGIPEWLATHPDPENRRERITAQIAAGPQAFEGDVVGRRAFLRTIEGLVVGEDPRQGYFQGAHFYHPGLRFQLAFPEGWTTANQRQAVGAMAPEQDAALQLTVAEAPSVEAAARAFAGDQTVAAGRAATLTINGLSASSVPFRAQLQNGQVVAGRAAFIAHDERVFRILGYAPEARWTAFRELAEESIGSFRPLTDPAALAVDPWRIELVELERAMTLEEFLQRYPSPAEPEMVRLINGIDPGGTLEAGRSAKHIVGEKLPT